MKAKAGGGFGWLDFFGTDNPICPHCRHTRDISEVGSWHLYEEGEHEITCERCELDYTVSTRASYSFSTNEQDDEDDAQGVTE